MDLTLDFSTIFSNYNWWAAVVALIASMAWGFLWYSPLLAGRAWAKAAKVKSREGGDTATIVLTAFLSLLVVFVLGLFESGIANLFDGLLIGFIIGAGLVVPTLIIMYSFSQLPRKQALIDGVSTLVNFCLMGAVFGVMT